MPVKLELSGIESHTSDEAKAKPEWDTKDKSLLIYVPGTHFNEHWKKGVNTELASGPKPSAMEMHFGCINPDPAYVGPRTPANH